MCYTKRLTPVIPFQQQNPIINGFPPVLISFTTFEFNPMADIASTIKNLLNSLKGINADIGTPKFVATVVITEANIK